MKKFLFLLTLFSLVTAIGFSQPIVLLPGVDTIGNGRTLTSASIKISETLTGEAIYPTLQTYVDYTSGTENMYVTLWQSLDGVRWDTVGTGTTVWNFNYDAEADGTVILSSQTWTAPLVTNYLKATARGHTGVQSSKPRILLLYEKVNYP